jgi:putative flippase GtrA
MSLIEENRLVSLAKRYINTNLKRYIVVGGFAYVSEMLVIYVCLNLLNITNVESVAISYWFGLVIAFFLQKIITFGNTDRRVHILGKQLIIYAVLVGSNYLLTIIAVGIFSKYLNVYFVRTMVIIFITVINYNVYKIIFKNQD